MWLWLCVLCALQCRARNQFFSKMSRFVQSMLIDSLHFMHNTQLFESKQIKLLLNQLPEHERTLFWGVTAPLSIAVLSVSHSLALLCRLRTEL
jgi:hypothetical protein